MRSSHGDELSGRYNSPAKGAKGILKERQRRHREGAMTSDDTSIISMGQIF